MSAAYQAAGGQLRVMPIISTKMACQGSQEQVFADALAKADSYMVEESGTLILYLANEAGEITLQ
jgi:heat shock protein HslJ